MSTRSAGVRDRDLDVVPAGSDDATETKKRIRYQGGILTDHEILALIGAGVYRIDLETGNIEGPNRQSLATYTGNPEGHQFVRLYWNQKRKTIAVQRLVWLAGIGEPLPPKYEVHHINLDVQDNRFENLIAIHPVDHRKVHRQGYIDPGDTPF